MKPPSPHLNRLQAEPELKDVLNLHMKEIFLGLNCHAIGRIESFNKTNQTCSINIVYAKTFFEKKSDGTYAPVLVNYPLLIDCPVIFLGGGESFLTFPVKKGDNCLVLFNDRDIDNWMAGAKSGPVSSGRLHSFSDGIALVGLRPEGGSIAGFDDARVRLQNKNAYVGVGENKVKIANAATSLLVIIDGLIDILSTAFGVGNSAPNAGAVASLNAYKTQVGALLE